MEPVASTPIARNPTLWVGVLLFLLVGAWASVLISIAGKTATAQRDLAEAHKIVASSGHISASWPERERPITRSLTTPVRASHIEEDLDTHERVLLAALIRWPVR